MRCSKQAQDLAGAAGEFDVCALQIEESVQPPLVRRKLLERLLRPVGSLALAAIASGAFSTFLLRRAPR